MTFLRNTIFAKTNLKISFSSPLRTFILNNGNMALLCNTVKTNIKISFASLLRTSSLKISPGSTTVNPIIDNGYQRMCSAWKICGGHA